MGAPVARTTPLGRLIRWCQPWWKRAVENDPEPPPPEWPDPEALAVLSAVGVQVLAILPTHIGRPIDAVRESLAEYADQLAAAAAELELAIGLVVGVQYRDPAQIAQAVPFARALCADLPVNLFIAPMLLRSRIKVDTINAAAAIGIACNATWVLWIDDDITLDAGGLTALLRAAGERRGEDIWTFGLQRVPVRTADWVAQATATRRQFARRQRYPIGCCCLVRLDAPVWPLLRWSDDTWLAARVVDPEASDPYWRSCIVTTHAVFQQVAAGWKYSWSRIRRIQTNQVMTLAALEAEQAARYATSGMFGGVVYRSGSGMKGLLAYLLSLGIQSLSITVWIGRATWLLLRGMTGRPIRRPAWAVGDRLVRPTGM